MTTYFTKQQAMEIMSAWGKQVEPLPKKGCQLLIVWPNNNPGPSRCLITLHDMKSTYGKSLYKFEFAHS